MAVKAKPNCDESVGRLDRGDPRQRQLLDQHIGAYSPQARGRSERAFLPLEQLGVEHLSGAEIMRAAIGVEAHRQAVFGKNLLQRPEGRGRALLLDQKRRIDCSRRIVERHDQIERRLSLKSFVARAVLMQHHPRQRTPLALAPVRAFPRRLRHEPK